MLGLMAFETRLGATLFDALLEGIWWLRTIEGRLKV